MPIDEEEEKEQDVELGSIHHFLSEENEEALSVLKKSQG
jgi:hypothetical protein